MLGPSLRKPFKLVIFTTGLSLKFSVKSLQIMRTPSIFTTSHMNFDGNQTVQMWMPQASGCTVNCTHQLLFLKHTTGGLQDAPHEPGCTLEQVVAGMMLLMDATQLTTFGTAKLLWLCYLYFGNKPKYQWCKLTCKLCNNVAYFQTVSSFFWLSRPTILMKHASFLTTSRILQQSILGLMDPQSG